MRGKSIYHRSNGMDMEVIQDLQSMRLSGRLMKGKFIMFLLRFYAQGVAMCLQILLVLVITQVLRVSKHCMSNFSSISEQRFV